MSRPSTENRRLKPREAAREVARRTYRTVIGPARDLDPVRTWPGTAREGLPLLRVLHVGDCGIRRMDTSHDPAAPLGFPAVVAERMLDAGVGMEFFHYFAINYDHLPDMERLQRVMKLSGDPDVILVQLGATHGRRVVIPDVPRVMQFRYELSRRVGRLVFPWYKVLRPCVRVAGRHASPYRGPAKLERTLTELQATWPSAEVVLIVSFPRSAIYPTAVPIMAEVEGDSRVVAERCGATVLEFGDVLGKDRSLRCAAGYNLNSRGSQLVGEKLAEWLLERQTASAAAGALTH
jgi:hypothetical protein